MQFIRKILKRKAYTYWTTRVIQIFHLVDLALYPKIEIEMASLLNWTYIEVISVTLFAGRFTGSLTGLFTSWLELFTHCLQACLLVIYRFVYSWKKVQRGSDGLRGLHQCPRGRAVWAFAHNAADCRNVCALGKWQVFCLAETARYDVIGRLVVCCNFTVYMCLSQSKQFHITVYHYNCMSKLFVHTNMVRGILKNTNGVKQHDKLACKLSQCSWSGEGTGTSSGTLRRLSDHHLFPELNNVPYC